MLKIYGIKNCDTVKKALKWLEENSLEFEFHDYKKQGVDEVVLKELINQFGWEKVLNLKSRTYRALPENQRPTNERQAIAIAKKESSIIKRPIIDDGNDLQIIGFNVEDYRRLLG